MLHSPISGADDGAKMSTERRTLGRAPRRHCLACFASTPVRAQSNEDLEALSKQVEQLYHAGNYKEATAVANRALGLAEQLHGPDHPNVADALSDLALLYKAQSLYDLALPLWTRSLTIRENVLGVDHPDVATSLDDLARLYRSRAKFDPAEPLYQRALAIREKALGPDHLDVGNHPQQLSGDLQRPK